jgi:hypothetical protein
VVLDALADHGVLAHEDGGLGAERRADVHELAGANIVGADDERTGVVIEERAEFVVVRLLGLESRSGRHLC